MSGKTDGEARPVPSDHEWRALDWSTYTRDAMVRGRRVRFVDIGSGPATVLVHGLGGCWQWWLRVLPAMAEQARVIAIDLPGFGESEPVQGGPDVFAEHVATVIELLDHLGLARATLVGHSMGGLVALQAACDRPDRVSALALVDAGGAAIGPHRLRALLAAFRAFATTFSQPWVPVAVARNSGLRAAMFAVAVHDPRTLSGPLAMQIIPRMAAHGFIAAVESAGAAVNRATPEHVRCPTLVVWGARDRILPMSSALSLTSRIPDARLVSMARVGHCPMVETPVRLGALLIDFTLDPENGRPRDQSAEAGVTVKRRSTRRQRAARRVAQAGMSTTRHLLPPRHDR
ncbi:alpha/beta hydrolase [Mycobacterium antarcticum]|nr:alpha/beta hydrolase [Mycolicibacterium sp. TUM20985]GLP82935.1 alpha/beta hydrolase [Mycolicibacterium sp. TUM20984]